MTGSHEVVGSIPISSTNFFKKRRFKSGAFFVGIALINRNEQKWPKERSCFIHLLAEKPFGGIPQHFGQQELRARNSCHWFHQLVCKIYSLCMSS